MGRNRKWTAEEERLEDLYGRVAIPSIAKRLNRSVNAILVKRACMGLGAFLEKG